MFDRCFSTAIRGLDVLAGKEEWRTEVEKAYKELISHLVMNISEYNREAYNDTLSCLVKNTTN